MLCRLLLPCLLLCVGGVPSAMEDDEDAATSPAAPAAAPDAAVDFPTRPVKPGPRDWPAQPGAASVCLWKGDRLAAFSLTIDDNCRPDHDWWIAQGERLGFRFTWFIITGRVAAKAGDAGFWGCWDDFRKLVALGHDVQSHTVSHLHDEVPIDVEYREAKAQIEAGIPGHRALVLAYPGGKRSARNDPQAARQHYIGARGTTGLVTPAIGMPYLRTGSQGGGIFSGERTPLASFLDPGHRNYRGWHISLFHALKPELQAATAARLDEVKRHEADIWVGLFRHVVQYARERDAATLRTVSVAAAEIVLSLSDTLDDARFDLPLTVKVRLAPDWAGCRAEQAGTAVPCAVVEREGARFALVEAVPDRGAIALRP